MVALLAIFTIYVQFELEAQDTDDSISFRLVVRLMAEFGGFALVIYSLCWALVRLCTRYQLENYLASELLFQTNNEQSMD